MSADTISTRPRLDKLGVKPGHRVCVLDLDDDSFLNELATRGANVSRRQRPGSDLVFFHAAELNDLSRLLDLRSLIKSDGAIWVLRVKGPDAAIKDTDVINAGLASGLVDNKIVSFSDRLAAMRLVYRLRDRV